MIRALFREVVRVTASCFVIMPTGKSRDDPGRRIDFDDLYQKVVEPVLTAEGLLIFRPEAVGQLMSRVDFDRLMMCDVVLAELTDAPPDVVYRLGMRYVLRPSRTIILHEATRPRPLSGASLAVAYRVDHAGRTDAPAATDALTAALQAPPDDGLAETAMFRLLDGYVPPEIDHTRTDVFRERVPYSSDLQLRLAEARASGVDAIRAVAEDVLGLDAPEWPILVDLLLSFRAVEAAADMISFVRRMPDVLRQMRMVQEQFAFALNREGLSDEAAEVLTHLIEVKGPSSETNGLLGRVYKDRWDTARRRNASPAEQRAALRLAIDTYLAGFEADWRDPYPGINAVTLMRCAQPPDPRAADILPIVRYAAAQRIRSDGGDYWAHATMIEAAMITRDRIAAEQALEGARECVRESWEPKTTARNLSLIRQFAQAGGEDIEWMLDIEAELGALAATLGGRRGL
jgi:hypothetical protein